MTQGELLTKREREREREREGERVWNNFKARYLNGDLSKCGAQVNFNEKDKHWLKYISRTIMEFSRVLRSDRRHWGSDMKNALRVGSFPIEDTQNREIKHGENEVPAVSFHEGANFFRRSLNEEVKSFILQCNTSKQSSERRSQKKKLSTSPCRIKEMAFVA